MTSETAGAGFAGTAAPADGGTAARTDAGFPAGMPSALDYPEAAVPELLVSAAARWPEQIAVVDGEEGLTFARLLAEARSLAASLAAEGAGPGSVVGIQVPNSRHFAVAYWGVLLTGSAVTLVNPLQPAAALARQLREVGAVALISHAAHLAAVEEAGTDLGVDRVLLVEGTWAAPASPEQAERAAALIADPEAPRFTSFAAALTQQAEDFEPRFADPDAVAHYQFTGGTTGRSKAVRVLHRNVVSNVVQMAAWRLYSRVERDAAGRLALVPIPALGEPFLRPGAGVAAQVPPLFHAQGIASLALFAFGGVTTVLTGRFRPDVFADLCERWQVTYTSGNPPMFMALAEYGRKTGRTIPSMTVAGSGAAPLDATSLERIGEVLPNAVVAESYGLTEGTCVVLASDMTPAGVRRLGSVGVPIPDTRAEIRSADGLSVLPTGEEGVLWVSGPQVTDGYHGAPELTAAQFVDGWLCTGDIASIDAEGFCRIHDRAKDMLLYKGYNVYPRELEDVLGAHPAVLRCAVIGRPDEEVGELPVAFVVADRGALAGAAEAEARPGVEAVAGAAVGTEAGPDAEPGIAEASDEELREALATWFAARVLPYQKIREFHFVEELPVSAAGKVLKTELRTLL
ncbi:class I adenylate-forming enzyme family protein [Brevibacterium album]|uniref:class I adenylate-forming enzyme family protein n=1 Tax=Brevibacterium album TaxID=417948 RepID=UPI00041D3567|nr:AMP-binding protein [Brevibacterium album]